MYKQEKQENLIVNGLFTDVKSKIKSHWITALVAGMIIGLLTYGYFMSNHFLTYDSMWNQYSDQNMITSGRQFLQWACGISSYYDLPWLNGLLAVFYLAVTSVFVIEGLGIKSHINAALTAGIIVTFPSVISTFGYTFTVDGYMLAALLAAMAFLLADRKKWGFLPGAVLLGVSLGIYQSFLSFAIILCVLKLLLDVCDQGKTKDIVGKGFRFVGMGIGAYAFYLVSLNIMLKLQDKQLSGYQGSDKVQSFSVSGLPDGLKAAFDNFINFARWSNVLTTTEAMKYAFVVLVLAGAGIYGYLFVARKCYKNIWNVILVPGCVAVIPFGATVVSIISPETFYHLILRSCWCLFFVFVLALSERLTLSKAEVFNHMKKAAVVIVTIFSVILIFEFSKMANIAGYNQHERYEKSYSLCVRIADRLEQTEGYEHGMPVAILGGFPDYPSTDITADDLSGYFGVTGDYVVGSTEHIAEFMSHYLNITLNTVDLETQNKLAETEEYKDCPKFPANDCIIQIDGIWVIKLNG